MVGSTFPLRSERWNYQLVTCFNPEDNEEKKKLNWAVNRIAQLNLNQIQQWQQEYPDSVKNNTPANEKFTELALAALGGRDIEEIHKYNDKIMKNVLKEVILSREP